VHQQVEEGLGVRLAVRARDAPFEQPREVDDRAVVAERVAAEAERVGVLCRQPADRRAAHVRVEDPPAHVEARVELSVVEGGLGEAHTGRLLTLAAGVHGHAPARVVLLRLAHQRVRRLHQLVTEGDRLRRYAPEDAAHGGGV
jgi:hypothetical protein